VRKLQLLAFKKVQRLAILSYRVQAAAAAAMCRGSSLNLYAATSQTTKTLPENYVVIRTSSIVKRSSIVKKCIYGKQNHL
jgi:hypothetical protein